MTRYQTGESPLPAVSFEPRSECARCLRPSVACYCAHVVSIETKTRVLVLQHPRESDKAIGTARIAALALPQAQVLVGVEFNDRPEVRALLEDSERPAIVLYPSDDATDVLRSPPEGPVTLVVIDGTWHHARRIVRKNPWLSALPRYAFTPEKPSEYQIRHEPQEDYVSTIEALAYTLGALEGDRDRIASLLLPFRAMVETQLHYAAQSQGGRHRRKRRRNNQARACLPAALCAENVVCIAIEANAWPYDRSDKAARYPAELVYLTALRLSDRARFEAFLAPQHPLAPSPMKHARLPEERIVHGLTREQFAEQWRAFLRPDDVLCAWGTYGVKLLRAETDVLGADIIDLRKVVGDVRKQRPGSVEALVAQRELTFAPIGTARGGERLGMLVAATEDLLTMGAEPGP